ncbi:MAG: hypothetical protein AAF683_01720 [Pseudomonadota bacterium]
MAEDLTEELTQIPADLISKLCAIARINQRTLIQEVRSRLDFTMEWASQGDITVFSRAMRTLAPLAYARLMISIEQAERMQDETYESAKHGFVSSIQPLGERDAGDDRQRSSNPVNAFAPTTPATALSLEKSIRGLAKSLKYEAHFNVMDGASAGALDSMTKPLGQLSDLSERMNLFVQLCEEWEKRQVGDADKIKKGRELFQHARDGEILAALVHQFCDYIVYEWHEYLGLVAAETLRGEQLDAYIVLSDELKPKVSAMVDEIDGGTVQLIELLRPLHMRISTIWRDASQMRSDFANED